MPSTADLAAATPAERDRYLDLLRVASIAVVVIGHWLMAAVTWDERGVDARNLLQVVPSVRPLTWLLQVMPVFFLVGGYANARSWVSTTARGGGYADFLGRRCDRLLRPIAAFLVVWVAVALAVAPYRAGSSAVRTGLLVAVQPLWFVAIYVLVVALTPPMLRLHERYGARVPLALVAVAGAVDALRLGYDVAGVEYLNYGAVWLLAHQLGFFYRDGRLQRIPRGVLAAVVPAGVGALALLTTVGPYPVSMVGLPGDRISNIAPPSVCIVVLTMLLTALLLLLRPAGTRWAHRPRVWQATVAANTVVMTVFVWQLTVLVVAVAVAAGLRLPSPAVASVGWWLSRPVWIAVLAAVLLAVVRLAGRWETRAIAGPDTRTRTRGPVRTTVAALAAAYVVLGLAGLALSGLTGLLGDRTRPLLFLTVGPLLSLLHLALGAGLAALSTRAGPARNLGLVGLGLVGLAVLEAARLGPLGLGPANAAAHLLTALALALLALRLRPAAVGAG